jgi:hypothetical protein
MKFKICPICNKEFIMKSNNQIYCSGICKDKFRFKKYYRTHKEQCKQYKINYNIKNKEKVALIKKLYRQSHKSEIQKYMKKYREEHKEIISIQRKDFRQLNKEKISKYMKQYSKKYQKILNHKIAKNLRTRIGLALKGNPKLKTTMKLVGCSIDQLKQHLQSQFIQGMNWDNYGRGDNGKKQWQIDHIVPCVSFDLSKPEEQKKCFHYTNLQPLWKLDNLKKGNR